MHVLLLKNCEDYIDFIYFIVSFNSLTNDESDKNHYLVFQTSYVKTYW